MSKQVNYNENLCSGAAIRDDKGRRISKLFEASHPKMTVGYAKNLIMPDNPTEQEFNFRQSGGGVIEDGVAVIDKVKGNSVVWNQLRKDYSTGTNIGLVITQIGNSVTIKGTADSTPEYNQLLISAGVQIKRDGTKYLYLLNKSLGASWGVSGYGAKYPAEQLYGFFSTNEGTNWNGSVFRETNEGDVIDIEGLIVQLIDLTQMFGAGNEPTTYEEFLSRKPKVADEYAYNEGTIVNNKVEKVKVTGVNLWDESKRVNGKYIDYLTGEEISNAAYSHTGYVRVLPNTEYYFKQGVDEPQYGAYYDADKNFILGSSNFKGVFTTPAQAAYVRITLDAADSSDNICINLSDPTINGQYFPYEKHELDLSWIKDIKDAEGAKLFEDGMKSAGTAYDEVRKDKAVRRVGVVDLGSLEWWYNNQSAWGAKTYAFKANLPDLKSPTSETSQSNYIIAKYTPTLNISSIYNGADKVIYVGDKTYYGADIVISDSAYTDAASFKAAMAGVMLYYELAEPIEVEYDEKNLTYPVIAGGTEEAIAIEPSTAFRADIGYGIDAVKTILDLKARVEALEAK